MPSSLDFDAIAEFYDAWYTIRLLVKIVRRIQRLLLTMKSMGIQLQAGQKA